MFLLFPRLKSWWTKLSSSLAPFFKRPARHRIEFITFVHNIWRGLKSQTLVTAIGHSQRLCSFYFIDHKNKYHKCNSRRMMNILWSLFWAFLWLFGGSNYYLVVMSSDQNKNQNCTIRSPFRCNWGPVMFLLVRTHHNCTLTASCVLRSWSSL